MGRGGKRTPAEGKRIGRPPKPQIEIRASKGIASTVLSTLGSPYKGQETPTETDLWMSLLADADKRLRFDVLKYLTDRRDGKPAQGMFVGDTRETARELDFGDLPELIAAGKSVPAGKPN
jgi:hypothetical protein